MASVTGTTIAHASKSTDDHTPATLTHGVSKRLRRCLQGLGLVLLVPAAHSGEIKGTVVIKNPQPAQSTIVSRSIIQRYVSKSNQEAGSHGHTQPTEPSIVVYIDDIDFEASSSNGQAVVLDQTRERFVPHVLPILVGTTVRFFNSDDVYHNVFSLSATKSFDLGRYATGKYRSVVFDRPGIVKIYCDIHTHMNAFILVLKNPYFTTVGPGGNFRLPNVPPGKYVIKAWYGRGPEQAQSVTVSDSEMTTVNFEFP